MYLRPYAPAPTLAFQLLPTGDDMGIEDAWPFALALFFGLVYGYIIVEQTWWRSRLARLRRQRIRRGVRVPLLRDIDDAWLVASAKKSPGEPVLELYVHSKGWTHLYCHGADLCGMYVSVFRSKGIMVRNLELLVPPRDDAEPEPKEMPLR